MSIDRPDNLAEFLSPADREALAASAGCEAVAVEAADDLDVPVDSELAEAHRDSCDSCGRRQAGAQGLN